MLKLRRRGRNRAQTTTVEPAGVVVDFAGSDTELAAEIERLIEENRVAPNRQTERRLLALRHISGIRALADGARPDFPEPEVDRLPPEGELPEVLAEDLTPGLVRGAILRDGFILVRGLVPRERAVAFGEQIDRAFVDRERFLGGEPANGYYEEFPSGSEMALAVRPWVREGGGVLAADSPMLSAQMIEIFREAGLPQLVEGYLGERPLISLQKTTLRKAEPSHPRRLASGRELHGRRAGAQPVALTVAVWG